MKHGTVCTRTARAVFIAALLMAPALSAEIYRWTDENGVTHFSQTPPPDGQEAEIEDVPDTPAEAAVEGAGIDFDGAQSNRAEGPEGTDTLSAAEQKRQEIAERHADARAAREELERLCNQTRSRLARIEPNRRVYYTNDEGETVRMDDEERVTEVEELRTYLAENCP